MKTKSFFNIVLMFLLAFSLTLVFNSCSEDDVNDEKEPPTNTTDSENNESNQDEDEDNNTGDNKVECKYCGGSGDCPGSNCNDGICFYCDGTGKVQNGKYESVCMRCERGKCPVCNGRNKCPKCNGKGYTYK